MFSDGFGASRLRWGAFGLAATMALISLTSDPAEARHRHRRHVHRSHASESYSPPFASIVVDANTGSVLQATNADSPRHPASLTKIMTLYLLFERLEAGRLKLSSPLSVSTHASVQSPTKLGLKPGTSITVENAIKGIVTRSANDAAVVIAEALGGDEESFGHMMTRKAHALGMQRTVYVNASGLPDDRQITTARDQAVLGRAIQERFPRYYRYFSTEAFEYHGVTIRNHNHLLNQVEGVDGIKTGYTRASGFNLVTSMWRGRRHVVAVVLGGRSSGQRDAIMRGLLENKIELASTKRTAPVLAEAPTATEARPVAALARTIPVSSEPAHRTEPLALHRVADAGQRTPSRIDPASTATIKLAHPKPGSRDPIKPLLVKTIRVKGAAHTADRMQKAAAPVLAPTATHPSTQEPPDTKLAMASETAPAGLIHPASSAREPAAHVHSGWIIQVGAFDDENEARARLNTAQSRFKQLLRGADPFTERVVKGEKALYRARFAGLDKEQAQAACRHLKRNDIACLTLKN